MDTKILKVNPINPEKETIKIGANIIKKGGLVAFPTETVYGLGADATNSDACKQIYQEKGRASDNPLIVHVSSIKQAIEIAYIDKGILDCLNKLWPGPVTFIFKKKETFPDFSAKGTNTVAVRMPAHQIALALIREAGVPIAAPSANLSGRPSPTCAEDVLEDLDGKIEAVIDGGDTAFGIESTVLDLTSKQIEVLRPGAFTIKELETVLGKIKIGAVGSAPKSPGMKYRHYAPRKRMIMASESDILETAKRSDKKVAILCSNELAESIINKGTECKIIRLGSRQTLYEVAKNLFGSFRKLDRSDADEGVIETFKRSGLGYAIMNRIEKATEPQKGK